MIFRRQTKCTLYKTPIISSADETPGGGGEPVQIVGSRKGARDPIKLHKFLPLFVVVLLFVDLTNEPCQTKPK
jgi:hypothetical protein